MEYAANAGVSGAERAALATIEVYVLTPIGFGILGAHRG
jgi:hypothetical protein